MKVNGLKKDFAPVAQDASRIIIGYGLAKTNGDLYEWHEVYLNKKQHPSISFEDIRKAVIDDIDERTTESIVSGMVWNGKPVWLSLENQQNIVFAAMRGEPVTTKIGEDEDGEPVYHEFKDKDELTSFWNACQDHINACRERGWREKASIDWTLYGKKEEDGV